MRCSRRWHDLCLAMLAAVLLAACSNDNYDAGDGKYSYLTSDFVEAFSASPGSIRRAVTDADEQLEFSAAIAARWATKADSVYRALLYYNKVGTEAEPVSIVRVPVLQPVVASEAGAIPTDPLEFVSAWVGKNRKYLNIGLGLKTGKQEEADNKQQVGVVTDAVYTRGDGTQEVHCRLTHSQNGVPEYYTSHVYVSIPLQAWPAGTQIYLSIATYKGTVTKRFSK